MSVRCYVNADCWADCDGDCCYAIWKEPNGPCSCNCCKDKVNVVKLKEGEKFSVAVNGMRGETLARIFGEVLPEDISLDLNKSTKRASFSMASASRDDLVATIKALFLD